MIIRLKKLRTEYLKLSQEELAEKIGLKKSAISDIERGKNSLKENNLKLICQTFNVNEEWLRNGTEPIFKEENEEINIIKALKNQGLKPNVLEIVENYIQMDDETKKIFTNYLEQFIYNFKKLNDIIQKENSSNNTANLAKDELSITTEDNIADLKNIKFYDTPVSAGKGSFINDYEPFDIIKVNLKTCPQARRCDFALKVRGDSMEPYYYDGDIVFVKEQPSLDNGQIGIFIYEDESYIKKYSVQEDGVYLISLNKNYPPIKIDENNAFKICGLVLR